MNPPIDSPPRDTGLHPLLPEATAHHQAGRLREAERMYHAILQDKPGQFDAAHLLGVIALQEGRLDQAARMITAALESKPDDQAALSNLTAVYLRANDFQRAAEVGERAARLLPPSVDAMVNYGTALHQLGRYREAIGPLEIAHFLNQRSIEVCNLLGACLLKIGDPPRAVTIFTIATQVSPLDSASWANLSIALNANSEPQRSLLAADRAVILSRDPANALEAQASAQLELGKIEEAVSTYEKSVELSPTLANLRGLARALISSGRHDEAISCIRRAIKADPSDLYVRLQLAVAVLKPIYSDIAEMQASRVDFHDAMLDLQGWLDTARVENAYVTVGAMQPFFIAYHPFNNRELLSQFGNISARLMRTMPGASNDVSNERRTGKMRVGIVSGHIFNQSVWIAILKGWIQNLDKSKFDLYLFKLGSESDNETNLAKEFVTHFDDRPKSIGQWADAIRSANLDAVIFDEIGMHGLTLQLAATRLAPLQCATWGHPETSGLPTIDAYISGDALEPPGAQDNYRERLVRLPNLGVYVEPLSPKVREPDLKELGLPATEPLLICAGSPFKYQPIHDWVWIRIARGLGSRGGRLVFFSSSRGAMNVLLLNRLRNTFSKSGVDFDSHVCIVPFQDRPQYFGLMKAGSIMLDTLDFSGFNTAIQAIEVGLPYLAYEGSFMRGRLASALLRTMDMPELVANSYEDFASKAVELATNPTRLSELRVKLASRSHLLFRDLAPIRALEGYLSDEIGAARGESK